MPKGYWLQNSSICQINTRLGGQLERLKETYNRGNEKEDEGGGGGGGGDIFGQRGK